MRHRNGVDLPRISPPRTYVGAQCEQPRAIRCRWLEGKSRTDVAIDLTSPRDDLEATPSDSRHLGALHQKANTVQARVRALTTCCYGSFPRRNGVVPVEHDLVIVADRFEHPCALCVIDCKALRIPVKFQRLRHGGPLAGCGPCGNQGAKRLRAQFSTGDWILGPREVCVLAENCGSVVVPDQFSKLLRAISGDLLEPACGLRMRPRSADPRQARICHVAHEGMLEDELEFAGDTRCRVDRD